MSPRTQPSPERSQLRWGALGIVVAVIALAASAVVYAAPFGTRTYVAEMRGSGGLRSGDEVRVAGIKVGTVASVRLSGDHVELRFGVEDDVPVGDTSAVEVKLLTPIGGHYLALTPSGSKALGDKHIPPERTSTSAELTDVLEQSVPALEGVDGPTLRATVAEINRALHGQPDAIRDLLGNVDDITAALADRTDQLDRALDVTDEYIGAVATDEAVLLNFVRKLGVIAVELGSRKESVSATFQLLRRLAAVVHRPITDFEKVLEPVVTDLDEIVGKVLADQGRIDEIIATIKEFVGRLATVLGVDGLVVDQSHSVVTGTAICVPAPGRTC
ncbi:MCE family protein [Nocardia wallacei]|uniref:MCE family protein n=1 Tax=Nocardia wallacei TaxID=480035 RepID=UPI0024554F74|nr:MCE family protein [Nocardia wallacei]